MKLNLKDRVLILKSLLPEYDTKTGIEISSSIKEKLKFNEDEENTVSLVDMGNGQFQVLFRTESDVDFTEELEFVFTIEELDYMKEKVEFLDSTGRFSEYTYNTYVKILNEPNIQ